jgi:hypothetical protein
MENSLAGRLLAIGDIGQSNSIHSQYKGMRDEIERIHKGGKSLQWGAAQFHGGGFTGDPSFMGGREMPAILLDNEFVINPRATRLHRGTLEKMNRGEMPAPESGGTIIIQAVDAKSIKEMLRDRDNAKEVYTGLQKYALEGGGRG